MSLIGRLWAGIVSIAALIYLMTCASMAFAQTVDSGSLLDLFSQENTSIASFIAKAVPFAILLMAVMRLLSEAMLKISAMTDTKEDDKWAALLGSVADRLAALFALIGIGLPKAIIMDKAETVAMKELQLGTPKPEPVPPTVPGQ